MDTPIVEQPTARALQVSCEQINNISSFTIICHHHGDNIVFGAICVILISFFFFYKRLNHASKLLSY